MIAWILYTRKPEHKLWDKRGVYPDTVRGVNALVRDALAIGVNEGGLALMVDLAEAPYEERGLQHV